MFFIVGSARSGTTLIRMMLNAHPEVAVPPESRFITELWRDRREVETDAFLDELARHHMFSAWDLGIDAVRAALGDVNRASYSDCVEAAYRAYARAHDKTRWGDKTPRYIEHIPLLAELFPDARFVHLVRDGRDVALSYAQVPFGPKTVAKAAALWAQRVRAGIAAGRSLAGRYIEIRYEDLVEDPEGESKSLCDFLGFPWHEGMLEPERARKFVLERAARHNPRITEPPTPRASDWTNAMRAIDVEVFEVIAGDVLAELAYPRRYPHPKARARVLAALGRAGLPLGRL